MLTSSSSSSRTATRPLRANSSEPMEEMSAPWCRTPWPHWQRSRYFDGGSPSSSESLPSDASEKTRHPGGGWSPKHVGQAEQREWREIFRDKWESGKMGISWEAGYRTFIALRVLESGKVGGQGNPRTGWLKATMITPDGTDQTRPTARSQVAVLLSLLGPSSRLISLSSKRWLRL